MVLLLGIKEKDGEVRRVPKETNKSPLLIFPSNNKYEQTYLAPYSDLFISLENCLIGHVRC